MNEQSLKYYRDLKNVVDTAEREGLEKGIEQGMKKGIQQGIEKVAINLKATGMPIIEIAKVTGLSEEIIARL